MMRRSVCGLLALAAALTACSLLVSPDKELRCAVQDGSDPCPQGSVCSDGRCRAVQCTSVDVCGDRIDNDCDDRVDEQPALDKADTCNDGADNDCDGTVDEHADEDLCGDAIDNDCDTRIDEGHDADDDGVLWCGNLKSAANRDCDDLNPLVSPQKAEICDGRDNDCDTQTDEPPTDGSLCPEGQQCVRGECIGPSCALQTPETECGAGQVCVDGQCVAGGCTPSSCAEGTRCDASGVCVREMKRGNGDACLRSSDCLSGLCADRATMKFGGASRICVQACCADSDCGSNELCIASGTGARSCLPRASFEALGKQCTNSSGCATGDICAIDRYPQGENTNTSIASYTASVCLKQTGGKPLNQWCLLDLECASRLCVPSDGSTFFGYCSTPCGASSDCGMFAPGKPPGSDQPIVTYCRVVRADTIAEVSFSQDYLSVCVINRGEAGTRRLGESCRSSLDCADAGCIGATANSPGVCAPTCCKDDQCKAMNARARCVPIARGQGNYEMRCLIN